MSFERNLILTLFRKRQQVWRRHYSRIDTALPRITEIMILSGQPGDVAELAHVNGKQLGTVRLKAGGHLVTEWIWD